MRNRLFITLAALVVSCLVSNAGEPVYRDASAFPVYGKISDATNNRYERLPSYLEGVSRGDVWYLGRNSAGLYVRFRTDSKTIYLKWDSMFNNSMNHMTDTGTKGLDLYAMTDDGGWRFVRSARPGGKHNSASIVSDGVEREYMLYLSLYDGVSSLQIGVDEGAVIGQPQIDSPRAGNAVIMYGTSILQGGCANRPGMAHTNILARELDREVINLGFSGNALLDYDIAELMASYEDPSLFVLDYAPNSNAALIDEKGEKFFRILRDAHPDVPVIIVERPDYPHGFFDKAVAEDTRSRNDAQKRLYDKLRKAGEKKLYYVESEGMIGDDGEATVDGVHFTDLGMVRYVEHLLPVIKKALKK